MLYGVCGWSVELNSFSSNEKEQLWAWEYMTEEGKHDLYIDIGEEIRSVQLAPVYKLQCYVDVLSDSISFHSNIFSSSLYQ